MNGTRTSAKQIAGFLKATGAALGATARHIQKLGLVYGFLFGSATTIAVAAALLWYGVFAFPLPWKVTDPTDPRFDKQNFTVTDYGSQDEFDDALEAMFPIGTKREAVDAAMEKAGARIKPYKPAKHETSPPNLYYYEFWNLRSLWYSLLTMTSDDEFTWRAAIYFDEEDRVERVVAMGP